MAYISHKNTPDDDGQFIKITLFGKHVELEAHNLSAEDACLALWNAIQSIIATDEPDMADDVAAILKAVPGYVEGPK